MSPRYKPPPVSKLPGPKGDWNWRKCYFRVGDKIRWRQLFDRTKRGPNRTRGQIYIGTVAKVDVNCYGRVSYTTRAGDWVMTEDIMRALTRPAPRE